MDARCPLIRTMAKPVMEHLSSRTYLAIHRGQAGSTWLCPAACPHLCLPLWLLTYLIQHPAKPLISAGTPGRSQQVPMQPFRMKSSPLKSSWAEFF